MTCMSHFITVCNFKVYNLRPWLWKQFCLCLILNIWSISLDLASQHLYVKGNSYLQSQGPRSWNDRACMFPHACTDAIKCLILDTATFCFILQIQNQLPEFLSRWGFKKIILDVKMFISACLTCIFGKENICLFKLPRTLVIFSTCSCIRMTVSGMTFEMRHQWKYEGIWKDWFF